MNWKLILRLSGYGLVLALGSIFFIPRLIEPVLWLVLYLFWAYTLGKRCRHLHFLHGLLLGILNALWLIGTHDLFLKTFLARHPRELATIEMVRGLHIQASERAIMSVTGLAAGVASGVVIGVFALIAGMMVRPRLVQVGGSPDRDPIINPAINPDVHPSAAQAQTNLSA